MTFIFLIATAVIALLTLLPLSRHPHWLIRGMDFPRLQLAVLSGWLVLAQLLYLDLAKLTSWGLVAVALICLVWHLWWILPYTKLWQTEVKTATDTNSERQISIITANVLTPNRQANKLITLVKRYKPDILVTLESDLWWQQQLEVLEADMPYSIKCPLDNLYGMHVYSRLPLADETISFLVEQDVPSMHAQVTLPAGDKIRLHFLHPAPPSPTENPESAERDAELVMVARSVADSEQPLIVTGDLNDVAWSATTRLFRKLSGLLDPRVGRGMFNTFHCNYWFLRWPLDHLFHSHHFSVRNIERLPSIGSDHFALYTELVYIPSNKDNGQGLDADATDKAWAEEVVNTQDVSKHDVPKPGMQ
jgi:endonuclease/exonuclease/phosphatase (EEP) superfamily protein YafD